MVKNDQISHVVCAYTLFGNETFLKLKCRNTFHSRNRGNASHRRRHLPRRSDLFVDTPSPTAPTKGDPWEIGER
jgi:hypothetical protein